MSPTAQPRVLFTSDDGSESLDDIRKGARAGSSFSEARQLFSDPPLVAQTSGFGRNEVHGEEVRESAHKLAEIMSFLDQVEQDVVAEPTAGVSGSAGAVASAGLTRCLQLFLQMHVSLAFSSAAAPVLFCLSIAVCLFLIGLMYDPDKPFLP